MNEMPLDKLIDFTPLERYFKKNLTKKEEHELLKLAQKNNEDAILTLLSTHKGFVINLAKRHAIYSSNGLEFQDFVQEGFYGLLESIKRFDINQDVRFLTYAGYYISVRMEQLLYRQRYDVRISAYFYYQKQVKYREFYIAFFNQWGRTPTIKEIQENLNMTKKDAIKVKKYEDGCSSLDSYLDEENLQIEDLWKESIEDLEARAITSVFQDEIWECINHSQLTPKQKEVIELKFGLSGESPMTKAQIAERKQKSRSAIAQIEKAAFEKLIIFSNLKNMNNYLDNPAADLEMIQSQLLENSKIYQLKK